MINEVKDIKIVMSHVLKSGIDFISRAYIFDKLIDKQIISDDKYFNTAMWMAYVLENYKNDSSFLGGDIQSLPFKYNLRNYHYYLNNIKFYISGKMRGEYDHEGEETFSRQIDKPQEKIPKSIKNKFEIKEKMRKILENSNNVKQLICPDLVRVVLADDFDQRFKKSLDKNQKVRPEILFEGYRKNAEVEDDMGNTAKSDEDLNL